MFEHKIRLSCPKISLLAAAMVATFAQGVSAFGTGGEARSGAGATCAFSVELQTSYETRRLYLVRLEQATGKRVVAALHRDPTGRGNYWPEDSVATDAVESVGSSPASAGWRAMNGIDPFSLDCISCHDGATAIAIGIEVRNRPFDRGSHVTSFKSDHPIGMDYNSYVAVGRGYKPLFGENRALLIDGKVGCLSCHDPLNPQKGHLVVTDKSTSVCHKCHDK